MEIIKIVLVIIAFSLPFISLHPGRNNFSSLFSNKKNTKEFFLLFLALNSSIQYLSYFSFIPSILLKLALFILTGLSISGPVIYLASYFSTSALLINIIQKAPKHTHETFSFSGNQYLFIYIAGILCGYILLITIMNSRKIIKLNLYLLERTNQAQTLKLLLSILLSFKFTRLNIYNKRTIAAFGIIAACTLTIADNINENIGSKNFFLFVSIFSSLLLLITSMRGNGKSSITFSKYIQKGLLKVSHALERVDLIYTCYAKDKDLYFLEDSLKLYKKGMRMLSGGRSKTMIFKSHCGKNVVKIFSNGDKASEDYYSYIQSRPFQNVFPSYRNRCNIERTKNITKVIYPYFNGESLYTFLLKNRSKSTVDDLTNKIVSKTSDLHLTDSLSNIKHDSMFSQVELEKLNLEYLNSKLFANWNLILAFLPHSSLKDLESFKRAALALVDTNSLRYSKTIHGDLTFSNIIIQENTKDFIYIDPNPSSHQLLPATIVDWSKIMQSCSSQWELAIANPGLLNYLGHNASESYSIPSPINVTNFRLNFQEILEQQGYNLDMLRLHEAVHLSRALPYITQEKNLAKYVSSRIISLIGVS